jgi:hypothetical protein
MEKDTVWSGALPTWQRQNERKRIGVQSTSTGVHTNTQQQADRAQYSVTAGSIMSHVLPGLPGPPGSFPVLCFPTLFCAYLGVLPSTTDTDLTQPGPASVGSFPKAGFA